MKAPARGLTRSANWLKSAQIERRVRKTIRRQERLADIDHGYREPQRPGQPRDGGGVVPGAEDHEVGRRQRDLEEKLGAGDRLETRSRVRRAQPVTGTLDRLLFDDGIGQAAGNEPGAGDDHPSRDAGERRHEHRRLRPLEDREPRAHDHVVFEPFDKHVNGAAATETQTPDRIVRQVVAHDDRVAAGDDARRGLGNRRFQAAAGQRTDVGPVLADEHPRAFASIRAPRDAHDRRQRRRLPGRTCLVDDFEEPFSLASIHAHDLRLLRTRIPGRRVQRQWRHGYAQGRFVGALVG